jgi:hypothetical protein
MVAFYETAPAVGDENHWEKFAGTWLQFSYFSRVSL